MRRKLLLLSILGLFIACGTTHGATIETDTTDYAPGETVAIVGSGYSAFETVLISVEALIGERGSDTWEVEADATGNIATFYDIASDADVPDTLLIDGTGQEPETYASTTATLGLKTYLNQLHNGTLTASPGWALGNINSSNSCYAEGRSVPFRYFIEGTNAGTEHYFTIQCEWTKGGAHGYDYFTDADMSEADAISDAGGFCSSNFASPPPGCNPPSSWFAFPDPTDPSNYMGSLPADFFYSGFALDGPRNLGFFNATVDSVSAYYFTGSDPNYELNIVIHFTTASNGTVGFYWGGHLAEGTSDTWGTGNGSGAIAGSSYHMRVLSLDGGGGQNQDKSINNSAICLPPDATITCSADSVCSGSTYVCTAPAGAASYDWTVTGATISSGQGTNNITYTVTAYTGESVIIELDACDATEGCPEGTCCSSSIVEITVGNCCDPPVATCPGDTALLVCDLSEICLPGFDCTHDATVIGGYLSGNSVCFTPVAGVNDLMLICSNDCGEADTCNVQVTVAVNSPPVCNVPADQTIEQCTPTQVSLPVSASDVDGNLVGCTITSGPGTIVGGNWVYTPTGNETVNVTVRCTDECGVYCEDSFTIIFEMDSEPPTITCPSSVSVQCPGDIPAVNINSVTAPDNCDPSPVVIHVSDVSDGLTCPETITRTYRATDASGNSAECTQTITIDDTIDPVITCPANITIDCNASTDPSNTGSATATDNCTASPAITYSDSQVGDVITRTWTATDDCGNTDQCVQTITIEDTTDPVVTCPDAVSVQCPGDVPPVDIGSVIVSDNCDPSPVVIHVSDVSDGLTCPQTITRTYRATDASGNSVECTQMITIDDTIDPVITCPADVSVDCNASTDPSNTGSATATDNCTASPAITYSDSQVGDVITRTWTATDDCGNTDQCVQTITIEDTTDPVITCPDAVSVQCPGDVPPVDIGSVIVSDNCDPSPVVIHVSDVSDGLTCPQTITRTYRATDASGNSVECTQMITIDDTIDPVITCPADVQLECGESIDPSNTGSASATDNCIAVEDIVITYTDSPAGNVITRTWVATDECNNSAQCDQLIQVGDGTAPECNVPNDTIIFQCVETEVSLPVSGTNNATCEIISGPGMLSSGFWMYTPTGDETVNVTVRCTDDCGLFCEASFEVEFDINEAPVCDLPDDTQYFVCDDSTFNFTIGATDADDNLVGCSKLTGPGTFDGTTWTFTTSGPGVYGATFECEDECEVTCGGTVNITVDYNSAPICTMPNDTIIFQCAPTEVSLPYSVNDVDGNEVGCSIVSGPGSLVGGNWVYEPMGEEEVTVTIQCVDECGSTCEGTFTATFDMNEAPVCPTADIMDLFVCEDTTLNIAVPAATDVDGNLDECTKIAGPGTYSDGIWVFTTTSPGSYDAYFECVDECGAACTTYAAVGVTYNSAPVCSLPGNTTVFQCDRQELCLPVSATDIDGNLDLCEIMSGPGTLADGNWCYTPSGTETVDVTIRCTDECDEYCEGSFSVQFLVNNPPVCYIPDDIELFLCSDSTFNIPISATDPDGNLIGCSKTSGPGSFDGTTWTLATSGSGDYCAVFECEDSCGEVCSDEACVSVTINSPPECHVPNSPFIGLCEPSEIVLQAYGSDVDGNLTSCQITSGPGVLDGDFWRYTPTGSETVTVTMLCTDACGAFCEETFTVEIVIDEIYCVPPIITIEKTHDTYQGHYEYVSITWEDIPFEMGGFDFLIAYDASALTVMEVLPGQLLEDCGWEYFNYRFGFNGNCGGPCPSGMLRIIAIAELNNGANHPSCFGPPDADPHELARIKFYVTNDRTFECQYAPVTFFWYDCGDNSISNVPGDVLYIDRAIYDFEGNLIWDENDDDLFPEDARIPFIGAPDYCLNPDPDKPTAIRFIKFKFGGIDIICSDSIDAPGDLNLNNVANEIADVVLYTNYFIYGLSVFDINVEGQIAASDINKDGRVLTIGDLVYLTRIITGDAVPFTKLSPFASEVDLRISKEANRVELSTYSAAEVGAMSLVFDIEDPVGEVVTKLSADLEGFDMLSDVVDGQLRVLIHSLETERISSGENGILEIEAGSNLELVDYDFADYYGNDMRVNVDRVSLPKHFSVSQNFPNPFNPETEILLTMPQPSDWTITIYNVAGQIVKTLSGYAEAGTLPVRWHGYDESGNEVASGVYLYKVDVGEYSVTKKMLLLK